MKQLLILILLSTAQLYSQKVDSSLTNILPDSLFTSISDSLSIQDSLLIADSLKLKSKDDIDAVVFANAQDSLNLMLLTRKCIYMELAILNTSKLILQVETLKIKFLKLVI